MTAARRFSARGTARADRVRRFMHTHVRHMKGRWAGKPFDLEEFQWKGMVLPTYGTLNRAGRRKYRRALYGIPRFNGKSEIAAGLHIYHLFGEPVYGGEQYAFATTKKQAAIIFDTAKRMIQADPLLRSASKVYRRIIEIPETGATFEALPFDADTSQGFHANFATGDEVHVMRDLSMVDSIVSGQVGHEEALFVAITTEAEKAGGSLDELRERWANDPLAYTYWQGARLGDDPTDPRTWRRANPASFITEELLRGQFNSMPLPVFMRYHLNLLPPTQHFGARAFNPTAWHLGDDAPDFLPDLPVVVGVDAAPRRDKTAVILDQRHPDGTHHVKCYVFDADPEAGLLDFDELKQVLHQICKEYRVARIVVDPNHLFAIMDQLLREGLPVEDFPQHASRLVPASMNLYDLVQMGRIRHGNDPKLTEHVLNAAVKEIPPSGWRITKARREEYIDAAIALAMAAHIAEAEWSSHSSSFAARGLLEL